MSKETPLAQRVGEPEWEELRERRVYGRIRAELATKKRSRAPLLWAMALATTTIVVTAGIAMWAARPAVTSDGTSDGVSIAKRRPEPRPHERPTLPHMSLADGSRAYLSPGAKVHVERQDKTAVHLLQRHGQVRYMVKEGLRRNFVVRVDDLRVVVVGTVFTLSAKAETLRVTVQRGRVQVHRGGRTFPLGAHEELTLPRITTVAASKPAVTRQKPNAPKAKARSRLQRSRKRLLPADLKQLLKEVDTLRRQGKLAQAATRLREVLRKRRTGSREAALLFTLAKVEIERRRFAAAATIFARCRIKAPSGPLAEDALVREALARKASGQLNRARELARRYIQRYPAGIHRKRLRELLP